MRQKPQLQRLFGVLNNEMAVRRFTAQIDTFRRKEVLERNIALRASGLPCGESQGGQ